MAQNFDEFSIKEAMRLANSDAGQALYSAIKSSHSQDPAEACFGRYPGCEGCNSHTYEYTGSEKSAGKFGRNQPWLS